MTSKKKTPPGINVTIPEKSAAKAIDALLDIFSPVTQGLGLVGDRIKAYRQQQKITLTNTLTEARRIAKQKDVALKPPPQKFLLPYLESASIEDDTDESMRTKYANLLVAAGTNADSYVYYARSLLSDLPPSEARILDRFVAESEVLNTSSHNEYLANVRGSLTQAAERINIVLADHEKKKVDKESAFRAMSAALVCAPTALVIGWNFNNRDTSFEGKAGMSGFSRSDFKELYSSCLFLESKNILNIAHYRPDDIIMSRLLSISHLSFSQLGYGVVKRLY